MPPFVGRVLEPSVAGISVSGDCGFSDITMPGDVNPELLTSLMGDGSGEALRSGAIWVVSARPAVGRVMFSREAEA